MSELKTYLDFTEAEKALIKKCADKNYSVAMQAQVEFAEAIQIPLREGVLSGNIRGDIFTPIPFEVNSPTIFPLDWLVPGTEDDYVAYVISSHGALPERRISSDELTVPTYQIGNSISWLLRYAKYARVDVVGRALEVLQAGFTKKMNDDAWATLLAAAVDRNILVYDSAAANGQFTKRLVSLMKTVMRRNGGGNSTSQNRHMLTDLYISPELMEDMRNWNIDQVDELTRREIYLADDNTVKRVFSVNLHDLDELGVAQQYQNYYTDVLAGTMNGSDVEIVIGLDQRKGNSFVMPVVDTIEVNPTQSLFDARRQGYWATAEIGFGVLDNRCILVGSA